MAALLNNASMVHDYDDIRLANGGEAVGNHKACSALHQVCHGQLNRDLRTGIDAGRGFIQDENGGIS